MNKSVMPRLRMIRFRSKTLLLGVALVASVLAYPAWVHRTQGRLVTFVMKSGGDVIYQCEVVEVSEDWKNCTFVGAPPLIVRLGLAEYLSPVKMVKLPLREDSGYDLSIINEVDSVEKVCFYFTERPSDALRSRIQRQLESKIVTFRLL